MTALDDALKLIITKSANAAPSASNALLSSNFKAERYKSVLRYALNDPHTDWTEDERALLVAALPSDPDETTTLNVRGLSGSAKSRLEQAAQRRGYTYAEYLERLVDLHDAARARADDGDDGLQAELTALGLQTVSG